MSPNPEQEARRQIDAQLQAAGWAVQDLTRVDFGAARGVALREVPLESGRCDYLLLVDRKPVGIVELRIAVTVDMIATGTDIKPLECLLFLRDLKSRVYFDQMKGRGMRVLTPTDLQSVSGAPARHTPTPVHPSARLRRRAR